MYGYIVEKDLVEVRQSVILWVSLLFACNSSQIGILLLQENESIFHHFVKRFVLT